MDESIQGEIFDYLFELQETNEINMMGAGSYIQDEYSKLTASECREYLVYWMANYTKLKEARDNID